MPQLTFDVRYDNEMAHEYYGEGGKLTNQLRDIYNGHNLEFPDEFDSTSTYPPIHFIQVTVPDDVDIDSLKNVDVPAGLSVEIIEFD